MDEPCRSLLAGFMAGVRNQPKPRVEAVKVEQCQDRTGGGRYQCDLPAGHEGKHRKRRKRRKRHPHAEWD